MDQVRNFVEQHPAIAIEDTPQFYDMEVFNRCVQTRNPLMTLECWSEVHPSLVTLPVDWDFTIPYGILYAPPPGRGYPPLSGPGEGTDGAGERGLTELGCLC